MDRKKTEMKKWAKEHMKGVENTLFPSFTPDMKELDEEGIRLDVRQSIAHGFFSMLCATETGLTLAESKRFVEIAAEEAKDKILVTTTLILNSFEEHMELMEHAEKVGLSGVLLGYPITFHPEEKEEIYEVTKRFCEATNMHITLYPSPHFPFSKFHNSGFPLDVMVRLADIPNVVAVKIGELGMYADVHRMIGDKVLLGCPVERYVPLLIQGSGMQWMGAGCYEVFQSPEKPYLVEYFNLLLEGKADAAMEIYWKLAPMRNIFEQQFNQTVMTGTYNWHQQKFYQWCTGGNGGLTRQPAMKLHQWEADAIKMGFYTIDIIPPDNDAEFYIGKMNYARMKTSAGEDASSEPDAPSIMKTYPKSKSVTSPKSAVRLSLDVRQILSETEAEMKMIPAMIRPMVKSGFKKKTGGSIQDWIRKVEKLIQELEADTPFTVDAQLKESLAQLANYYREAPGESRRFVRDDVDFQTMSQKMADRAEVVSSLIAALEGL